MVWCGRLGGWVAIFCCFILLRAVYIARAVCVLVCWCLRDDLRVKLCEY